MPHGVRRKALVLTVVCAGALLFTAVALAGNGGIAPQPAASPGASSIRESYWFIVGFTTFVFVIVEGALVAFIIRYRRGKRPRNQDGLQIHGSTRLEIIWTVLPVLILVAIGAFVFVKLPHIADAPKASAADETTIRVEGRQFYWMFHYPNGAVSVGTMVAPADNVVNEEVFSPTNDVLHSWWVPRLAGKIDAIPGRTNHTWFKAPAGTYPAVCGDLCGIQHTMMQAAVEVVPRAQYEQFIAQRAANPSSIQLGQEEFQHVCAICHRLNSDYVGPALGANPVLTHATDLTTILRQGVGKMPAVGSDWTQDQIDALVTYTKTLVKNGGTG
jgi:cytochrome c oxidase subunit 2